MLGVPVYLAGLVYTRVFLAAQRSDLLLLVVLLTLPVKLVLNILFASWLGVAGLALATTVMYALSTLLVFTACQWLPSSELGVHGANGSDR